MPACRECVHFDDTVPRCDLVDDEVYAKSSVRSCERAMFLKYLPRIKGEVLEIGFGKDRTKQRKIDRHRQRARWTGVEPRWVTSEELRQYQATVTDLPFDDSSYDWVICFSSIEHWTEYGDQPKDGIKEIHRVLKAGGKMLISLPIHYHGDDVFYYGYTDKIAALFDLWDWSTIHWDHWRRRFEPLPKMQMWQEDKRADEFRQRYVGDLRPTWYMEVLGIKA